MQLQAVGFVCGGYQALGELLGNGDGGLLKTQKDIRVG
jgi:hypothetical protein